MPAVKSIPIRDEEEKVIAYRFEASNEFAGNIRKNYTEMQDEKGRVIKANKKLALAGHYADKGYEAVTPKKGRDAERT